MLQFPSFKTFIHAEIIPQKRVILFDEKNSRHLLEGEAYVLLTPYLSKGSYSIDQIINHLREKISASEIYYALLRLKEKGFLEEASTLSKPLQTLCNLLDVPYEIAENRLKNTTVSIHSFGNVSIDPLYSALKEMSIRIEDQGNFSIGVTDHYRNPKLREMYLQSKTPYLLIKPTRSEIWVGPLFIPGKGPCLDCLLDALKKNFFEELFIEHTTKRNPITIQTPIPSTISALAYNLAANEIVKWILQGSNPDLESKLLSYHFLHPKISSHQVIKKTHCATCGTSLPSRETPFILESQKKHFTEDGGHRIKPPEETYQKYEHLISPITGIIEFLIPSLKQELTMMHVYKAAHQMNGLHFDNSYKNPRGHSAGKGKSKVQAKTSCLCEAIERYSGIYQGNEQKKRAIYKSIKDDAIHPSSVLLFSENQYKSRKSWNLSGSSFHYIPDPFDETQEIDWTPAWSLTEKRTKWIPTAMCYFNYPFPERAHQFCKGDSNGCAAGNTKEEATLQGFFELVERDHIALWWYSRCKRPEVDLKSFSDPHIERLVSSYASIHRKLWVLDLTMDLKIPTFAAISCKDDETQGEILFGFGSHFDPNIALLRSLTEMNQPLLFLKELNPSMPKDAKELTIRNWLDQEVLKNHSYLVPDSLTKKKKLEDYVRFDTADIKDDLLMCQKIIESKGLEMLVLDQTRPDIGLAVVKVFVPGLRHFWNRYAPGRLYDIPLELGLVQQKLKEEELNPIPFFL